VAIPHEAINTIEDEKEIQAQLQISKVSFIVRPINKYVICQQIKERCHSFFGDFGSYPSLIGWIFAPGGVH
jgi:hypothetical protein